MSQRGTTYQMVPTLRHSGYGGPGERRWRRCSYRCLTRASAHRWLALAQGGQARIICHSGPELLRDLSAEKLWKSVDERAGCQAKCE